jgi:ATP-dependent Clp protease ATP-binding subunit ClpA
VADTLGGVAPSALSTDVTDILLYAMQLAWTSETYEVHSWMVLLGILRKENSAAAQILSQLGVEDLYGAWHEVLWALNASDGLKARAFTPKLRFAYRARKIVDGSLTFASFAGRDVVKSEDMLLALAAGAARGCVMAGWATP